MRRRPAFSSVSPSWLAPCCSLIGAIASSTGLAVVGAIIVILTMIGAVATHARIGDPQPKMAPASVLGVLAVLLLILA